MGFGNVLELIFYFTSDLSCRTKLAVLNEKLTTLERKIDYLEACVRTMHFFMLFITFILLIYTKLLQVTKGETLT